MGSRSAHRVFGSASTFQCPVLAEKAAAKPVGEMVCWKAARAGHDPSTGQGAAGCQGRSWGRGCQRDTWQEPGQLQWPPPALPIRQHPEPPLPAGMAWTSPQKSALGESRLRSQSWVLGKWFLHFKQRVVERKEQPQSKALRKILQ